MQKKRLAFIDYWSHQNTKSGDFLREIFSKEFEITDFWWKPNERIPLEFKKKNEKKIFYDVIYNPKKTNFLLDGENLGNKAENGIRMFIYQAQLSFKIWHNIVPEVDNHIINYLEND